jgi:hypothetical protein
LRSGQFFFIVLVNKKKLKLVSLKRSDQKGKKYKATFQEGKRSKTTHFGAKGMDDYTLTHDKDQRSRYRQRHKKDLKTHDPTRAGFLSYYLLWGNSTSLKQNLKTFKSKFHV